jgi:hypothetical protein
MATSGKKEETGTVNINKLFYRMNADLEKSDTKIRDLQQRFSGMYGKRKVKM